MKYVSQVEDSYNKKYLISINLALLEKAGTYLRFQYPFQKQYKIYQECYHKRTADVTLHFIT
jgi:hypothetical protein